jgi:ribosomal protein S18 acetylase RimI-like enzyme
VTRLAGFALESDPWLADLLGRPAHRLGADGRGEAVFPEGAFFATAKVAADDIAAAGRLEDMGFRMIDMALSFAAPVAAIPFDRADGVRQARPEDCAAVAAIARDGFRFSRFHLDPRLPKALAGRIKAAWAENFFKGGRGDAMIVASVEERVVGFLQLLRAAQERLVIDLIAVDERFRGGGLARAMIASAVRTMPAVELRVGTQAANIPSVRLYESLGFRLSGAQLVLHCHGGKEEYPA